MVCGGHRHLGVSEARTLPERPIQRSRSRQRPSRVEPPESRSNSGTFVMPELEAEPEAKEVVSIVDAASTQVRKTISPRKKQ